MKVYVLTESRYYSEDKEMEVVGVVTDKEEAEIIYKKLTKSVEKFNKEDESYEVYYDYKECELDDMSLIEKRMIYNNGERHDIGLIYNM